LLGIIFIIGGDAMVEDGGSVNDGADAGISF